MNTKSIHKSELPSFAFGGPAVSDDNQGYITYHDDPSYATMSTDDLYAIADRINPDAATADEKAILNAAEIEIAKRK